MHQLFIYLFVGFGLLSFYACEMPEHNNVSDKESIDLLDDLVPRNEDGYVNAVIEIPAGTIEKWEVNKSNGKIEWEEKNGKPRIVNYIGYPGNYGMIPGTLLSEEKGGDGDPVDILVLGPPAERETVLQCKIIGVLYLLDRGEQDDKLIAVSEDSPMYKVDSMNELDNKFNGVSEIIQLWFSNYKGPGKMEAKGYGNAKAANEILETAIKAFKQQ